MRSRCLLKEEIMQLLRNLLGLETSSPSAAPTPSSTPASPVQPRFKVGWITDVGSVRRHNEDTALVVTAAQDGDDSMPAFGIFILADGMGGHQAGEIASSLAARVAAHHIVHNFYLPTLISQEHGADQPSMNDVLVDAVQAANQAVADRVPGGGTTLTCALLLGPRTYIAHVGDSRAYVAVHDGLDQITQDHSLVDRLVELGQLTRDEAAVHPQKNVLYRAVGQSGVLEVDTYVRTIPLGGRLLLCSDGLWTMVSESEIVDTVTNFSSLQAACESLVAAAKRSGGHDNITAILVEPPLG
jgi:serine/threonine protein phosphatase PrpC